MNPPAPCRFSLLVIDRLATGNPRARTLPGGADRYAARHHTFADTPEQMRDVCRALGIGDDAAVLLSDDLDLVQVPVAPLRRARIDPILQYVNDRAVLDGTNATVPLQALADACDLTRSASARAFLARR